MNAIEDNSNEFHRFYREFSIVNSTINDEFDTIEEENRVSCSQIIKLNFSKGSFLNFKRLKKSKQKNEITRSNSFDEIFFISHIFLWLKQSKMFVLFVKISPDFTLKRSYFRRFIWPIGQCIDQSTDTNTNYAHIFFPSSTLSIGKQK